MPEPSKPKITVTQLITVCIAVAAGAWALNGELHNFRLSNITARLKNHETYIMETRDDLAEIKGDIKMLLDRQP